MRKIILTGFVFLGSICSLEALSLRFQNQTASPLTAEILSANGSLIGEVKVPSQKTVSWTDATFPVKASSSKSVTPLTVHWFDNDGELFHISDHVMTGSLLQTNHCIGKKASKTNKEPS
ncbi:MAG: hypothetical protein K2Y01_01460 [Rhabdochlamydiaceae bacterium]|nr:hypothetical protein [Rhabdochlamydiaceae bacterium]